MPNGRSRWRAAVFCLDGYRKHRFHAFAREASIGMTCSLKPVILIYYVDPQNQFAILPEMEGLNGKQIKLYARGYNAGNAFKIGMMTDPNDVSTFVEIATQTLTTSYQEYEYSCRQWQCRRLH